jgi:exonuclease SbcD
VELLLETDSYISAADRKRLLQAHDGILTIIPITKTALDDSKAQLSHADLQRDIEELFIDFFREQEEGRTPDEALLKVFREVASGRAP